MDEMLKDFLFARYEWVRDGVISLVEFDETSNEIDFNLDDESSWVSGVDVRDLLEFATNWSAK